MSAQLCHRCRIGLDCQSHEMDQTGVAFATRLSCVLVRGDLSIEMATVLFV